MTSKTDDTDHSGGPRRLLLMRHAKAAYPDHGTDHERPLAGRGRQEAPTVGKRLAEDGWSPDLVICSDAARAIETAELVIDGLGSNPPLRPEPLLYEAGVSDVLNVVATTPENIRTLLIVGHEPIMSAVTGAISGKFAHFPTATVAELELTGPWSSIEPSSGRLLKVLSPKD